jgi:LTXXQ motif family protein
MKRFIFGSLLGGALLAYPAAAQMDRMHDRMGGMMGRFSAEDMDAFREARIAALRAGLKLSADQEKLWPPVEDAMRSLATLRREQMRERREARGPAGGDMVAAIRGMADRHAASADGLRKLADATAPLYATFDEGQKRRLSVLMREMRPRGMHRWREAHDHRGGWHRGERDGR